VCVRVCERLYLYYISKWCPVGLLYSKFLVPPLNMIVSITLHSVQLPVAVCLGTIRSHIYDCEGKRCRRPTAAHPNSHPPPPPPPSPPAPAVGSVAVLLAHPPSCCRPSTLGFFLPAVGHHLASAAGRTIITATPDLPYSRRLWSRPTSGNPKS
jgi:hypothetical protein